MTKKQKSADRQRAGEVFRLFAWNIAGQLAKPTPPRPQAQSGRR